MMENPITFSQFAEILFALASLCFSISFGITFGILFAFGLLTSDKKEES